MNNRTNYMFFLGVRFKKEDLIKFKNLDDSDLEILITKNVNLKNKSLSLHKRDNYYILGYPLSYLKLNQKIDTDKLELTTSLVEKKIFLKTWEDAKLIKNPEKSNLEVYFI